MNQVKDSSALTDVKTMPVQNNDIQKLQLDYQQTTNQVKMLAEIRFKLLAFVPTLAAAAIAFLTNTGAPETALVIGILGFVMTMAITFYDIRNTQYYDAAVHRAKWLEAHLDFPSCTQWSDKPGGLFRERPPEKHKLLGLFEIWHDRGLALAYGAALGGWTFIIANSCLTLANTTDYRTAVAIAVIAGILFGWQYERLSDMNKPQANKKLKKKIEAKNQKKNE